MSLALETRSSSSTNTTTCTNSGGGSAARRYKIQPSGLIRRAPFMAAMFGGSSNPPVVMFSQAVALGVGKKGGDSDSCSSSSIGRNSDLSMNSLEGDDSGENEAQSNFKGPLDTMDSLEDVLSVKNGLSSFYSGKSKSFTSLVDVSNICSIKELAKPENGYLKKRKNVLAFTRCWDKKHAANTLRTHSSAAFKRQANGSRHLSLSGSTGSNNNSRETSNPNSHLFSPSRRLPPPHPCGVAKRPSPKTSGSVLSPPPQQEGFPPCRSHLLSDLRSASASSSSGSGHGGVDGSGETNF